MINPPGFAFEAYDELGRFRELDNGQPVDASGEWMLGEEPLSWDNGVEFAFLLAESPEAHSCYARHLFMYTHGRVPLEDDESFVEALSVSSLSGSSVMELMIEAVVSNSFRYRGEE